MQSTIRFLYKLSGSIPACAVASFLLIAAPAHADGESAGEPGGFIVLGAAQIPEYEGADELRTVPFVASRFQLFGREAEVDGLEFRYDLNEDRVWRAGPTLSVSIPRGDNADSAAVALLPEIDPALELGAYVGFRTPYGSAREGVLSGYLNARRDVTGVHDGWLVKADLEYFFAAARALRFGVALNATYVSDAYAETYFDVTAADGAIAGLPAFSTGGGLRDVGVELYSIVSFSEHAGVFLRLANNRLQGDFADSPIVAREGDENQVFYGVGYFRRF